MSNDIHHRFRVRAGLLTILLSSTFISSAAFAQEAGTELEEIVVEAGDESPISEGSDYTAELSGAGLKSGLPIHETPGSVTVITERELVDRDPTQIEDAIAYSAGVQASNWGVDDRFDQFSIRGFDIGSTGVYRDGLVQRSLNFSGFKIDPYMVQRIDVLRGPTGVTFGSGNGAGRVNVITKRPRFEDHGEARVSYGSYDTGEVALDMGGALNEEKTLAYRLVALTRNGANESDGSVDDRNLLSLGVTWAPTDATSITFLGHYQKDELSPNFFFPVAGEDYDASLGALPDVFVNAQHDFNELSTEQQSIGYQAKHAFSDQLKIRQNLRYAKQDTDYRHLYYSYMSSADTMVFDAFTVFETAKTLAVDTQLEYSSGFASGAVNTLLVGLDYTNQEYDGVQRYGSGYTISITDPSYDFSVTDPDIYQNQKNTIEETGLYLQNHTRFNNGVTVTAGLRQSWVNTTTIDRLANTETSQDDTDLSGSLGATWDLGNGFIPYLGYSEGFESNIGTDSASNQFDPSKSRQYEVGVRYQPLGSDLMLSAALYDLTKSNVLTVDPDNVNFQVQTGEVRHRGIELEARGRITDSLSAIASYAYVDAEITESNDGDKGNVNNKVPEHLASLWLYYDFAGQLSGLSLGGGVRYVGETWADTANTRQVDDYVLADLAINYVWDDYRVQLGVTNLLDNDYYATCEASYGCISGERREITFSLSRQF